MTETGKYRGIFRRLLAFSLAAALTLGSLNPVFASETDNADQNTVTDTAVTGSQTADSDTAVTGSQTTGSDTAVTGSQTADSDTAVTGSQTTDSDTAGTDGQDVPEDKVLAAAPENFKACCVIGGVQLSWSPVTYDGNVIYKVFRTIGTETDDWTEADIYGTVDGCKVKDEDIFSGETYIYAVCAYDLDTDEQISEISNFDYITYLNPVTADQVTLTVNNGSITIKWGRIEYAEGYYIYRKADSGAYKHIATAVGGTSLSYTDTASVLQSGVNYTYAIRPYRSTSVYDGSAQKMSIGYYSGKAVRYLSSVTPTLANVNGGIVVKWSKVTGASGYYVYRKSGSGSYSRIKTITSGSTVSYGDTSVVSDNGKPYTYAVRAYYKNSSGAESKGWYVAASIYRLYTGSVTSLKNSDAREMTVRWAKNSAASGYQVQYSLNSSFSSASLITVSSSSVVSMTISSLTKGKTYYVRVRSYKKNASGKAFYGGWSTAGKIKIEK